MYLIRPRQRKLQFSQKTYRAYTIKKRGKLGWGYETDDNANQDVEFNQILKWKFSLKFLESECFLHHHN